MGSIDKKVNDEVKTEFLKKIKCPNRGHVQSGQRWCKSEEYCPFRNRTMIMRIYEEVYRPCDHLEFYKIYEKR